MATPQKIITQSNLRAELSLSQRLASVESNEGPSFHHFTVTVGELLVVLKHWLLSRFFVQKSSNSLEINGFNRPRSGRSNQFEGKMQSELGVAKYRKDLSKSSATHRS
jgi:hypothetical protein